MIDNKMNQKDDRNNTTEKNLNNSLNEYYKNKEESMWDFNKDKGKNILEYAIYTLSKNKEVQDAILNFSSLTPPEKPDRNDFKDDSYDRGESYYEEKLNKYEKEVLPQYENNLNSYKDILIKNNVNLKVLNQLDLNGYNEVQAFKILLNDLSNEPSFSNLNEIKINTNNNLNQKDYNEIVIDTLKTSNKELRDNLYNYLTNKEPKKPNIYDDKYIYNDLSIEDNEKLLEKDQDIYKKENYNYLIETGNQFKVFEKNNLDIPPINYLDLNNILNIIKELNMNDNIKVLQDKIKILGFGDDKELRNTIEKEVKGNNIDFSINHKTDKNFIKNNSINFDLNFHKEKDTVFLNSYQVNLHNPSNEKNKDLSYLVELNKLPLTAKESINLIEGRNVKTDLKFKDQNKESYFLKMDFSNIKDNKIQSINKFKADLVKDTKEILKIFKINEEQNNPTIIDRLSKSLEKGNVVSISIKNEQGQNEKVNATLNPQMNTLNLYDEKMKRINITQSLNNSVSDLHQKTEHVSKYNNSRKI